MKLLRKILAGNVPADAGIRERKTARLGNKLILTFSAFTVVFLVIDEVLVYKGMADRGGSLLDGSFLLAYVVSWYLHYRGKFIGRILILVCGNFHAGIFALYFGPATGAQWHFLYIFLLPLLLFTAADRIHIFALMLLSIVLFTGVEIYFLDNGPLHELDPENARVVYYLNTLLLFLILGACVYYFFKATNEAETLLEDERQRSDRLLLNVLPPAIAARLKQGEETIADRHPEGIVLFSDIVGFTDFSQSVDAVELVRALNALFSSFDELTEKHGLEKIKTIGDAYMLVGGVPRADDAAAEKIAAMALDMRAVLAEWNAARGLALELRIGIHSGPVVAGVIGKQKFSYDLWGDTVKRRPRGNALRRRVVWNRTACPARSIARTPRPPCCKRPTNWKRAAKSRSRARASCGPAS